MTWFLIAATWLANGWIANRISDRYYKNAFPGTLGGSGRLIHCTHYIAGPVGLLATTLWLAADSYGFDGKKSPWRRS